MAALLSAAAEPMPPAPSVELESGGVILICGRDDTAVEAGKPEPERVPRTKSPLAYSTKARLP
jgi:hypothetical protein